MALDIEIDRGACIGSGNCVYEAPGAFGLDDESIAVVLDPSGVPRAQAEAAARKCPARAITVRIDGVQGP
jgi:ferredoxin